MKKSIFTLMGILMTTAAAMAATFTDDDRAIKYEELPSKARTFIADNFPNEHPAYTFEDREYAHTEYKVMMESGTKLEFNDSGEWIDVECRGCAVPAAIVPKKIADYVKANFPSAQVVEISKDHNDWDVKLSNGTELEFNNKFRLVDVDN